MAVLDLTSETDPGSGGDHRLIQSRDPDDRLQDHSGVQWLLGGAVATRGEEWWRCPGEGVRAVERP